MMFVWLRTKQRHQLEPMTGHPRLIRHEDAALWDLDSRKGVLQRTRYDTTSEAPLVCRENDILFVWFGDKERRKRWSPRERTFTMKIPAG